MAIRYVTLIFDANGGTDAPITQLYSGDTENEYISITIPDAEPTRTNYTFLGWAASVTATSAQYMAGETYSTWWASTDINYSQTLYAVWQENATEPEPDPEPPQDTSTDKVFIFNGTKWVPATPYIFDGVNWVEATPSIFDGSSWQ